MGKAGKLTLTSDNIADGQWIDSNFTYHPNDPSIANRYPHLKLDGLSKTGQTCGVVIIHDTVDPDDWCHGVLIFKEDAEIPFYATREALAAMGITEGINDLHRTARGADHNLIPETDPYGIGYIGPYPPVDGQKHRYEFDAHEVGMPVRRLFETITRKTRARLNKLGRPVEKDAPPVLTRDNVLEVIRGKTLQTAGFTGIYQNYGPRRW